MVDSAAIAGIEESDFWNLLPQEIDRRQWVYRRQIKERNNNIVAQAWMTAMFIRQRVLKSLNTLLHPKARKVEGEEKAKLQATHDELVASMGG